MDTHSVILLNICSQDLGPKVDVYLFCLGRDDYVGGIVVCNEGNLTGCYCAVTISCVG
jgi:hypothetical protein